MSSGHQRILIVRLGGIGDVVCTLPAVEAIRAGFPDARIGYAVEERAAEIIRDHPAIDTAHVFQRRNVMESLRSLHLLDAGRELRAYTRELRSAHYDLALDLQRNLKGVVHTLLSGAARKVGFTKPTAREFNHWFYREHIDPGAAMHWVDKFMAMAAAVGGKPKAAKYRLPEAPESAARVAGFLKQHGIGEFVAVHPSTSAFDPERRWEPERFAQLVRRISQDTGLPSIITWAPGEKELAERIAGECGGNSIVCFETKSLLDLAELYRRARLYVGLDTGPMHIATAVGLPSVVLFGSGNPAAYGPRSPGSRIVANYAGDRIQPMESISIEQVVREVLTALSGAI